MKIWGKRRFIGRRRNGSSSGVEMKRLEYKKVLSFLLFSSPLEEAFFLIAHEFIRGLWETHIAL